MSRRSQASLTGSLFGRFDAPVRTRARTPGATFAVFFFGAFFEAFSAVFVAGVCFAGVPVGEAASRSASASAHAGALVVFAIGRKLNPVRDPIGGPSVDSWKGKSLEPFAQAAGPVADERHPE